MNPALKRLSWKHKNNKVLYYGRNFARQLLPGVLYRSQLEGKLSGIKDYDFNYLRNRVNYYNKLAGKTELPESVQPLLNFTEGIKHIFSIAMSTQDIFQMT
jgi:hypothetical protein